MILYNWDGGKHLLIDVAVVNPFQKDYRNALWTEGGGRQVENIS